MFQLNAKDKFDIQTQLLQWYADHHRVLPWRQNRDPYRIWISEVMLQQTTVAAVVPFYERFIHRFPNLSELARAPQEAVIAMWAGLGYYSRARNLHASAKKLVVDGFPKNHQELMRYPGFGPYTARAVTSLAFGEQAGVVDGNVIRVYSRLFALDLEWWKPKARQVYQELADQFAKHSRPDILNQAWMELGAVICSPTSPDCAHCPLRSQCRAFKSEKINQFPRSKPRRAREIWVWQPHLYVQKNKLALIENNYAPFLKGQWFLPGTIKQKKMAPKNFDFRHSITHHDIFVLTPEKLTPNAIQRQNKNGKQMKWVEFHRVHEVNPTSLVQKVLEKTKREIT